MPKSSSCFSLPWAAAAARPLSNAGASSRSTLPGPASGNPYLRRAMVRHVQPGRPAHHRARLLGWRRHLQGPLLPAGARASGGTRRAATAPELNGKTGSFTVAAAAGKQPRTGAGLPDVLPALRRRHALSPVRHHLLRLGASAARASGADAQDARRLAVQQDPVLRLSQELLRRQQERAGALRLPEGRRRQVRLQPARPGVLAALRAAHPRPAEARHRGRHHPLAPLRPLGIRRHERRGGRSLPALLHRPALGLPQRLVVAGQRIRFHDRSAARAIAATSNGRTGTGSSRSSRRKTRTSGCAAFTTAASGTTTRRPGSRTPASRPRT